MPTGDYTPQMYLSVGTLFLLKTFSLPLLSPWLRRPVPKQSLKYHGVQKLRNQGGRVRQTATRVLRTFAKFAKTATIPHTVAHKGGLNG